MAQVVEVDFFCALELRVCAAGCLGLAASSVTIVPTQMTDAELAALLRDIESDRCESNR